MIICLSGLAGSGKDTVALMLRNDFDVAIVALADPMKEFVHEVFGFTHDQLWGPSEMRNAVDERWGVSPRHVLQSLGTEWGRTMHPELWLRYGLKSAERILKRSRGVRILEPTVVITDCRFVNEVQFFKKAGAKLVRILRPASAGLEGAAGVHVSETEQGAIPDADFDHVLINDGTLDELLGRVEKMMHKLRGEL